MMDNDKQTFDELNEYACKIIDLLQAEAESKDSALKMEQQKNVELNRRYANLKQQIKQTLENY